MKKESIHIGHRGYNTKENLRAKHGTNLVAGKNPCELESGNKSQLTDSCFIHHSGRQFSCVFGDCKNHESCFRNELLHENLEFHALKSHPDDEQIWRVKAFQDLTTFCRAQKNVSIREYRISFNHRYIRKDGSVSQFLHEGTLSYARESEYPSLNLFLFTEIGDIKTDETLVLSVFRHTDNRYEKVFNKVYQMNVDPVLTQRELEILRLCQAGMSSKMIADKLNLSIHTVKNHKRKCMEKTLTHNISELLYTCSQNHWL